MSLVSQPTGLTCTVSSGSGTATANVTNVSISCSSSSSSTTSSSWTNGQTSPAYNACNSYSMTGKSWRVPTFTELRLLTECTSGEIPNDCAQCTSFTAPTINSLYPNTVSGYYWSSSGYPTDTTGAYSPYFGNGSECYSNKSTQYL
ncbi:MAG: DUF1566 domain-containing protein [Leptospiraceae bacterium]|nr:DUF1566 domain-containing protein [Leptospiraceae bacterium]MCP5496595.1 DUF1566 domain-containing protein [Leptospiraceae bacterium]